MRLRRTGGPGDSGPGPSRAVAEDCPGGAPAASGDTLGAHLFACGLGRRAPGLGEGIGGDVAAHQTPRPIGSVHEKAVSWVP